MSLMTHQDFQVCTIIVNHSYNVKRNGWSWYLCPSSSHKRIFSYSTFTGMWVQAIGHFAQATCAPEFGLPRPFNQRLLVLHVGGVAVKQWVKFKTNKFQNKKKRVKKKKIKSIWLTLFSRHSCDLILSFRKVCLFREKWVIKNRMLDKWPQLP